MCLCSTGPEPRAYDNNGTLTPDQAAGSLITHDGTRRQPDRRARHRPLRNNLLGLPLALATINMLRARDAASALQAHAIVLRGDRRSALEPYSDWVDFGLNLTANFGRAAATRRS